MANKDAQREGTGFYVVLIVLTVVFALILPFAAIIYIEVITIKGMVHEELSKTVRLRKQIEKAQTNRNKGEENDRSDQRDGGS